MRANSLAPRRSGALIFGWLGLMLVLLATDLTGQEQAPRPGVAKLGLPVVPAAETAAAGTPLPINLPTALKLADARPIDILVASQRIEAAAAQLERARLLWLPTVLVGADYFRHDGQLQDIAGKVFTTSRSSVMVGAGPAAVFAVSDAVYAPLAARQVVRARQANLQAALNDSMLAVAEGYFIVQQARGELAGAAESLRRATELVLRTEKLVAPGLTAAVEVNRAKTELARRKQGVQTAYERWQTASAELTRLLRLAPSAVVEPIEAPHLRVDFIDLAYPVDDLIPVALTNRPELTAQQALVQATLARLRQERIRPLIPSVLLRGNATNPAGTLSGGYFGGGVNDNLSNFNWRHSFDVQLLWEFQNLGFGNRALVKERRAENELAVLELFRVQDHVAAEVVQAHAQAQRAANRVKEAQEGLIDAIESADKNIQGLGQTRKAGELLVLVLRPQEVVAAIQALNQAYADFYAATADANRAQFRLYRALGHPAQSVLQPAPTPADRPAARLLPPGAIEP
jgi:outer membrane protein TolC